jgi:hypothetical protein
LKYFSYLAHFDSNCPLKIAFRYIQSKQLGLNVLKTYSIIASKYAESQHNGQNNRNLASHGRNWKLFLSNPTHFNHYVKDRMVSVILVEISILLMAGPWMRE